MTGTTPFDVLPGGVPSLLADLPDRYFARAAGGRCYDQEGRAYIDFACGFGSISVGHCDAAVNEAAAAQLRLGMMMLSDSPAYGQLWKRLQCWFPSAGGCRFFKTGSEAASAAARVARAYTGKNTIIRCGFHGWHDLFVSPHVRWHLYDADAAPSQEVEGVVTGEAPGVVRWSGSEMTELWALLDKHHSDLAAVIVDPVQIREPIGVHVSELCRRVRQARGVVIFDEAKTAFRTTMGGVQSLYGVEADLTILSKAIANGFPLSVLLGRRDIIGKARAARIMGTYNGELLSIAAANRTLSLLESPSSIPHLWNIGQQLIDGANELLRRHGVFDDIRAVPYRWPCMPFLAFRQTRRAQDLKSPFFRGITERGLLWLRDHMNFTCLAHTTQDVADALEIVDDTLRGIR